MLNNTLTACNLDLNVLYEEMRNEALQISNDFNKSQGCTLFIQKGMASWLEAWTSLPSTYMPPAQELKDYPRHNLPVDLHTEVAILLTNMVTDVCQEIKIT